MFGATHDWCSLIHSLLFGIHLPLPPERSLQFWYRRFFQPFATLTTHLQTTTTGSVAPTHTGNNPQGKSEIKEVTPLERSTTTAATRNSRATTETKTPHDATTLNARSNNGYEPDCPPSPLLPFLVPSRCKALLWTRRAALRIVPNLVRCTSCHSSNKLSERFVCGIGRLQAGGSGCL